MSFPKSFLRSFPLVSRDQATTEQRIAQYDKTFLESSRTQPEVIKNKKTPSFIGRLFY